MHKHWKIHSFLIFTKSLLMLYSKTNKNGWPNLKMHDNKNKNNNIHSQWVGHTAKQTYLLLFDMQQMHRPDIRAGRYSAQYGWPPHKWHAPHTLLDTGRGNAALHTPYRWDTPRLWHTPVYTQYTGYRYSHNGSCTTPRRFSLCNRH